MTNIINKLSQYNKLNIVDIGHHKGHFIENFISKFPENIEKYILAIDPHDYKTGLNNKFIQKAISTKIGKRKFFIYNEPGCNSLSEMLLENKFQRPNEIIKTDEIEVECVTLESILNEENFDFIHYLKIDAQGCDLDVVKSAGELIKKCIFVQIESCNAKQEDHLMYINQNTKAKDIEYMKNKGFELFLEYDHSKTSCPESDLIFINLEYEN